MIHYIKIIVGSFLFATMIVVINNSIRYFIIGEFTSIINIRSVILFSIAFIISMLTTIGEGNKTS
ncbi:hypothetical protein [Sporosarcina sp. NPDC096371]|uniref:hypothetical protein n=1 Tax=Sporosarcina sp. NPDC096371 TaxID=3364530 RepID=UPI00382F686D